MEKEGIGVIEMWANTIMKQYTREVLAEELAIKNITDISKRILEIGKQEVYKGILENNYPPEDYLVMKFETCKKLIALAGYRMADLLNDNL